MSENFPGDLSGFNVKPTSALIAFPSDASILLLVSRYVHLVGVVPGPVLVGPHLPQRLCQH
jgi:hypothetical protein